MAVETLDVANLLPNKFEPKKQHRFVLAIEGVDAYLLKSAARPNISTEPKEIPFINSRRYVAGKTTFETMEIKLHDPIAPSGAQQVMEWIRLHFESVSGRAGYADFYKRDIALKMLDPVGTVIEHWAITGAFITKADFGGVSYESDDLSEISLTIRFDNCVLLY